MCVDVVDIDGGVVAADDVGCVCGVIHVVNVNVDVRGVGYVVIVTGVVVVI